ncbi:MAG: hypothetical protein CMB80_12885 [Flammeovirgaceae bacterium]|nr:hypothetical protein [Flammeovirgaceae bacterium]HCX23930.1 hypothetical protein [Cytophagales bacterium]
MEIQTLLENLKSQPSESYESEFVEFKNYNSEQSLHNAKDLAEEISALANHKGGKIIIGVIDSSDIKDLDWKNQLNGFCKIDLDATKERLIGKLNPKINLKLQEFEYENKNYLIIHVPNVNHSLVSTSSGKTCIRIGKSSYPATPDKIQELVKNLQTYDWSSEDMSIECQEGLDEIALNEAKSDFCERRGIPFSELSDSNFLESIGATKNGVLNKGGCLFLGKPDILKKYVGLFEFRFSWKTKTGNLLINDVWNDNIWNSIKRAKRHFNDCNSSIQLTYEGNTYTLHTLDEQAFHEAFLNSIVHRDYSIDGMTVVNFKEDEIILSNPGTFYGGVNSSNIAYHEPRHRNKALAKTLMDFQLVDRAGMGITRMGLNSLKYGREFPRFTQKTDTIEVIMSAEYFKTGVFLLTQKYIPDCGITELFILNSLYKIGSLNIKNLEIELSKIISNSWRSIDRTLDRDDFKKYFELKGSNDGVFICPFEGILELFEVNKPFKAAINSEKHISLYKFLKQHERASNEEVMQVLGFASAASTYQFLRKLKYVVNTGKSRNSRWKLK